MFDVEAIRRDFPILTRTVYGRQLVYLDSGATAQKPYRVIDKITQLHSQLNANIHRGTHFLSQQCTLEYEAARETVAQFVGADSASEIVFTSGATASINLVAYSYGEMAVKQGDNVIITEMEHHANIVPWQMLCQRKGAELRVVPFDDSGRLELEKLAALIDSKTRIVAVTQCSNVLGTRPDLRKIITMAHDAGVPVLVDGCQGVVHETVDMQQLDCDFYVFSGHKLYGPTGIGVLYAKRRWLDVMPPYMGGGDMVATVTLTETTYAEVPLKFEAGTANYIGAIGLAEAIRYLQTLDLKAVREHEHRLLQNATKKLKQINGLRIYGEGEDKASIVSFNVEGIHPYDIGMIVDKLGVAIRTGTHCAEPIMTHYGVTAMARASFAMYNTMEEIDELVMAIDKSIKMLK